MVDQIHQAAIDVVCPCGPYCNHENQTGCDPDAKIVLLSNDNKRRRPLYEIKSMTDFEIVQKAFQAQHRILLPTFNTRAYYSCEKSEMERSIQDHMTSTKAYRLITELDNITQHHLDILIQQRDRHIAMTVNNLFHYHLLTYTQWQQLITHPLRTRYDQLYFLPGLHRDTIEFRPMIFDRQHLSINIDRFLVRLLQPLYDHYAAKQTFHDGADALNAVQEYSRQGRLQAHTFFVTLYIHDLSASIPYEHMYASLQRFLTENQCYEKMDGLTIPSTLHLARLCLEQRYLLCGRKIYQQIKGGAFNSSLNMLLANIYLYYWQQDLVATIKENNEVFGRCVDEIFFTWNQSKTALHKLIGSMNQQDFNLKISFSMNHTVNYLDVHLSHNDGHLVTRVAHHLDTEPYSLPYVYGNERMSYAELIQAILVRAARCCTTLSDFTKELEQLRFSFRYNGFQEQFVDDRIQLFLDRFHVSNLKADDSQQLENQTVYERLRSNVLQSYGRQISEKARLKRTQKQLKSRRYLKLSESPAILSSVQSFLN